MAKEYNFSAFLTLLCPQLDYPAACNAAETLLIHTNVLSTVWPRLALDLISHGITLYCDEQSRFALTFSAIAGHPDFKDLVQSADDSAFDTEFLAPELAVRVVEDVQEAVEHINAHSSNHTDCILTRNDANAVTFTRGLSSANVFVNASTRFADGQRYGLGTEVGISTGKTHARGPVGLEGLCIYKWVLKSDRKEGSIVGEMGSGEGKRQYTHKDLKGKEAPF